LRNCRMVLKRPPLSLDEFIEKFRKSDLQLTANWLVEIKSLFESSA
jgi:hypothetical protein